MVDYCAVEYINATLKMKIRMIHIKDKNGVKGPRKGQGKKKTKKLPLFTKNNTQQLFFFYEKKKIYDLSSDDDDDD